MITNKSLKYLTFSLKLLPVFDHIFPFIQKNLVKGVFAGFSRTKGVTILLETSNLGGVLDLINKLKEEGCWLEDHIVNRYSHAVVLKVPINLDAFYEGQYSKIYTEEQLKFCSSKENKAVLLKEKSAYKSFIESLEKEYGSLSEQTKEAIKEGEYDKIPNLKEEVLYYDI